MFIMSLTLKCRMFDVPLVLCQPAAFQSYFQLKKTVWTLNKRKSDDEDLQCFQNKRFIQQGATGQGLHETGPEGLPCFN